MVRITPTATPALPASSYQPIKNDVNHVTITVTTATAEVFDASVEAEGIREVNAVLLRCYATAALLTVATLVFSTVFFYQKQ